MKRMIQTFARSLGYDIHKLPNTGDEVAYPYVEEFVMGEAHFQYWITDATYRDWYKPLAHAGWHETKGYQKLVEPNDRILEVGCNNGFTMCLLKSFAGRDAFYVGMDVIPSNCQIAASQIGLNALTNCRILHAAASDVKGRIKVFNTNNGFVTSEKIKNVIEVEALPCDELIPRYGYFDLVKIDVEGYEGNVLKGCRELLLRKPKLIIELHGSDVEKFHSSYAEIFKMIGVESCEGYMCLRDDNELRIFDPTVLLRDKPHVTVFLRKKPGR